MKRFLCLLVLVSAILVLTSRAGAAQMAGADAQARFAQWVEGQGGTHLDFDDLAVGTLLSSQYSASGVAFTSLRDPDGTAISKPVAVLLDGGSNEISGTPSWGSGSDSRVAYEVRFASPQKWAGLVRHGDNYYTITRFYNPSDQLIHTYENHVPAPGPWSRIFFGYLVESDDPSQWISRIECDGKLSDPSTRQVGYGDDLYYGTAEVEKPLPFEVSSATVTLNTVKGDHFTIKGVLKGFSFNGVETVLVEVGTVSEAIPLQNFEQNQQKYSCTIPRGKIGLLTLEIDLTEGTFAATGKNLILTGFTNPLPVKLAAGAFQECSMAHFRIAGSKWSFSSKVDPQYPCVLEEAPRADPNGVFVNTLSKVRIRIPINPNSALNQGSLKLFRVDENLKTSGKAICSLFDDGKASHGDTTSGDGVYSCIAPFNESNAGEMRLAIKAKVGNKAVLSPGVTIDTVVKLTRQQIDKTLSANKQAIKIWENKRALYGNTAEACAKALPGIRKVDGIKSAKLSSDGQTIWVTFQTGIKGALMLPLPPAPSGAASIFPAQILPSTNAVGGSERGLPDQAGARQEGTFRDMVQDTAGKCLLGNCSAFIYAPFDWEFGEADVGRAAEYILREKAAQYNTSFEPILYETDAECTISMLDNMTRYGTIIFSTHGDVEDDGNVTLVSGEQVNSKNLASGARQIQVSRARGRLYIANMSGFTQLNPPVETTNTYYAFGPGYIERLPGKFQNSIVFAGACHSLDHESLANAFIGKGAGAYFGFRGRIPSSFDSKMLHALHDGLIEGHKTTGQAFAAIPADKRHFYDPPIYDCYFLKAAKTNNNLAYNCPALAKYQYAAASIKTHGNQLWIYSDNATFEEKNVLFADGHYFPLEGRWTSGDTFTLDIKDYKDHHSTFTGKLMITLDLAPVTQEIQGVKALVFVLYELWSSIPGYSTTNAFSIGAYNLPAPVANGDNFEVRVRGAEIGAAYGIKYDWMKQWNNNGQNTWLVPSFIGWNDQSELYISIQKGEHPPSW